MKIKLNREAILVIIMGVMILFGAFYYGNLYFVQPLRDEAGLLSDTVEQQETLMDMYPPSEELLADYEAEYEQVESFLPIGVKDVEALVALEDLGSTLDIAVSSVTRNIDQQPIEGVSESFLKNQYTAQLTGESSEDFRSFVNLLMNEERIWNIPTLSYTKVNEENYTGQVTFELFYYTDVD